jgi:2-polyprenyl-6-methoxyphenol hydroxylase-like FAD-dependent oxidoreductase
VKYASHHGFEVRFSSELVSLERLPNVSLCTVKDCITKNTYQIRARYVFGADGGRSAVARMLNFSFRTEPSQGVACNILLNADLSHLMHGRHSQLHWIMKPDMRSRFGIAPTLRMVRPWKQWMLVAFTPGASEDPFRDLTPQSPELIDFLKEIIGDETVDVEILRLDPWVIRESVADTFSRSGNVFLLGDAAHRHPPTYGLGSNTCIQDAYNLAWKVAYVSKGLAGPGLLETYTQERQPVGADLVKKSNECVVHHVNVWEALGMLAHSPEEGLQQLKELSEATEGGAARRLKLHKALEGKRLECESLGLTMNQWYTSKAVYLDDEPQPRPALEGDPVVKILVSTYPGNRVPHAWLDIPTRGKPLSTQDLAGHGSFCLLTSYRGDAWARAAEKISKATGIPIKSYRIGFGLDYHDVYREWNDRRGVEEDGCVLVRPDRFVAWRSKKMIPECEQKLLHVLDQILFRDGLEIPLHHRLG